MKPRIRLLRGFPGFGVPSQWVCSGLGHSGAGSTPKKAYAAWLQSCDSARNAHYPMHPIGNSLPDPYAARPNRGFMDWMFG